MNATLPITDPTAAVSIAPWATAPGTTHPCGTDPLANLVLHQEEPGWATLRQLPGDGRFAAIAEVATTRCRGAVWGIAARMPTIQVVKAGTVVLVECWVRTVSTLAESGEGMSEVVFMIDVSPWAKAFENFISFGPTWERRVFAARAPQDLPIGDTAFSLRLAFMHPQTVQIAGVRVLDLGPDADLERLPVTRLSYAGRERTADWRIAAETRIRQLRMTDGMVVVTDPTGRPRPGVAVRAELTRHAFPFGVAVAAERITGTGEDDQRYRDWISANVNQVTIENHLKQGAWMHPPRRQTALQALAWLRGQGLRIRGHCLVWPGWHFLPKGIQDLAGDPVALRAAMDHHINDILDATREFGIDEWDVVNEVFSNRDLLRVLGDDEPIRWFQSARARFGGTLWYNDFAHLVANGAHTGFKDYVEQLIRRWRAGGAPVDGLGIQTHFGGGLTPPTALLAELDRLERELAIPVQITEVDVNTEDEALQGDYLHDLLLAGFSHPLMRGISSWGFWEGSHWIPRAAWYRRDWSEKPSGAAWRGLVHGTWKTTVEGLTDRDGRFAFRGFLGQYRIRIDGAEDTAALTASGAPWTITH